MHAFPRMATSSISISMAAFVMAPVSAEDDLPRADLLPRTSTEARRARTFRLQHADAASTAATIKDLLRPESASPPSRSRWMPPPMIVPRVWPTSYAYF